MGASFLLENWFQLSAGGCHATMGRAGIQLANPRDIFSPDGRFHDLFTPADSEVLENQVTSGRTKGFP
jgi:hypothetical protein